MRRIGREQYPTDSETLRAALVYAIRAEIDHIILAWLRLPRHESLILLRLSCSHLIESQVAIFTVSDAVQAVIADLRYHWKVLTRDHEIRTRPVGWDVVFQLWEIDVGSDDLFIPCPAGKVLTKELAANFAAAAIAADDVGGGKGLRT